ncbi:hypothetical protein BDQ17DRAFT_1434713 [Cyathus striatus]|nr:hypothetical protein BDQ17DRAFT_1434713 [Cyathus striatus]
MVSSPVEAVRVTWKIPSDLMSKAKHIPLNITLKTSKQALKPKQYMAKLSDKTKDIMIPSATIEKYGSLTFRVKVKAVLKNKTVATGKCNPFISHQMTSQITLFLLPWHLLFHRPRLLRMAGEVDN